MPVIGNPDVKFTGISSRRQDHAHGRIGPGAKRDVAEFPTGSGGEDLDEIAIEAMHERLGLGVAHADVVLEQARTVGGHHEAGVEEAGEAGCRDRWER